MFTAYQDLLQKSQILLRSQDIHIVAQNLPAAMRVDCHLQMASTKDNGEAAPWRQPLRTPRTRRKYCQSMAMTT
jgi:hypothetical protein